MVDLSCNNEIEIQNFILFKPYGYLSQFVNNQSRRKNKKLLGELFNFPPNTMAIGRLDETSEGLLFLTTDGKVSEEIRSKKFEKEYYVQVDGVISNNDLQHLINGVTISVNKKMILVKALKAALLNTPNLPERAKNIRDSKHGKTSWISITLNEGKFRQVRKMTAAIGFPTLRLVRVRIGSIKINNMKPGDVIHVNSFY